MNLWNRLEHLQASCPRILQLPNSCFRRVLNQPDWEYNLTSIQDDPFLDEFTRHLKISMKDNLVPKPMFGRWNTVNGIQGAQARKPKGNPTFWLHKDWAWSKLWWSSLNTYPLFFKVWIKEFLQLGRSQPLPKPLPHLTQLGALCTGSICLWDPSGF